MRNYGKEPRLLGQLDVECPEFMCYVSLPIRIPRTWRLYVPQRLHCFREIVDEAEIAFVQFKSEWHLYTNYTYLTVKSLWVTPESPGNRPGWHVDGFGSNGDINYIWCDKNPTEFAIQRDLVIPDDDEQSMVAMAEQVRPESIVTYPVRTLIQLDEDVVHRVGPVVETGRRTFVKITFSEHKFNLAGNSHNYLFDYDWSMQPRSNGRNLDSK